MPTRKTHTNYSAAQIEQLAERFRTALLESTEGRFKYDRLSSLVKRLGGSVSIAQQEHENESLRLKQDGSFIIYLSPASTPPRDTFTMCHELAHLILHTDLNAPATPGEEDIIFHRGGFDRSEWEANVFAANVLMPKEAFLSLAQGRDPMDLAIHFEVSPSAAAIRKNYLMPT